MTYLAPAFDFQTTIRQLCKDSSQTRDLFNSSLPVRAIERMTALMLAIALAACGGGGDASIPSSSSAVNTASAASASRDETIASAVASTSEDAITTVAADSTTLETTGAVTLNGAQIASASSKIRVPEADDVVSADGALYSSVPMGQAPANGFFFLNNVFGKGHFVNGVDYTSTLSSRRSTFPIGSTMQWKWPDATSGSPFAYAYPEIFYGGGPWGNPYNSVGPWPQRVMDNTKLIANYDITLGGNANSYDVLLDFYVTATPTSTDGSHVAEISFFPHMKDPGNMTGITTFSFGRASVYRQGLQILIRPITASNASRDIISGSIDIREVLRYLVSIGWITGNEYLRGAEFGVEVQVPNYYNSAPHQGSMLINKLSYEWN